MFGLSSFGSSGLGTNGGGPGNYANLFLPAVTLPSIGIAALALPSFAFSAAGRNVTGERSFVQTLGAPSVVAFGGANAALIAPTAVLGITGAFAVLGSAALSTPSLTVSAAGTVSALATAALSLGNGVDSFFKAVGYSGAVCSVVVGGATLVATGTSGGLAGSRLSLPLFALAASGTAQNFGSAQLLMPSLELKTGGVAWLMAPSAVLVAIGTASVVAAYEAYSFNLSHKPRRQGEDMPVDEATRYTNFSFARIVRYQGSYFGVAADGLYLLEGTTDDGAPIDYAVKTCVDDFGTAEKKTAASVCFGGRLGPQTTVTLFAGETGQENYAYATPRGQAAQGHREKFGRGVKNRYFAIGIAGQGALELDNLELDINTLTRRI